ncbi:MAG: DUF169 domain-containing protein [Dehalococcoidales bacterium]|nr:DUF169 domain-containing protein [Dehalococcoidales bacterium]
MTKFDGGEIRPLSIDLAILNKLELENQPVGIKFMYNKPEGVRRLEKNLAFCLMPEEAQNSGAFYVDETHFECAGPLCLGIANDDPFSVSGQIGTKLGLDVFQEARANRRIYEVLPTLRHGSCNYVIFAPLREMDFDPDVLIITGTARQAEIVLRSYSYSTGEMYISKTTPVIGCAWTFIYPYISGKLNYVVEGICFGHIARQVSTMGYVTVSIPFTLIRNMIENLKEMTWVLPAYTDGREGYNKRFKEVTGGRLLSGRDE